jgi:uncharacterized membrane protein
MIVPVMIIYIFAFVGLLDTMYLVYHKIWRTDVACPFFPKRWCQKVQYSKQSKTFGIPNSVAGFCIYLGILVTTWLMTRGVIDFSYTQFLIWFGFLFSMYFLYVQAFVLRAFCTWCVLSAVNFTVLVITQAFV